MILNAKKSSLLLLKGDLKTDIFGIQLPIVKKQKDLGVLVISDLTWSSNVDLRTSKTLREMYQIKRNMRKNVRLQAKLNAYTRYFVPILVYSSQVSHLSTMCLRKVEKIQRLATKWFFGVKVDYKTRLIKRGILTISMYIELHDILFMHDLLRKKTNCQVSQHLGKIGIFVGSKQAKIELFVQKLLPGTIQPVKYMQLEGCVQLW